MSPSYGQFCPVAVATELVARPWTPIILRELLAGAEQFNQIHRGVPRISRALLASRLRELEAAGVVVAEAAGKGRRRRYRLTPAGEELRPVVDALGAWGQRWTARVDRRNLDPGLLIWNMRRRVRRERLPGHRVVVRFRFEGAAPRYRGPRVFWLILERGEVDLCVTDPGHEVDLHVEAELAALARVWLGDASFESALRARQIRLLGPRALARDFPSWWLLSPFARVPRLGTAARAVADRRTAPAR